MKNALTNALQRRLGYLLEEPNMALAASALHPAFARLTFAPKNIRRATWNLLRTIAQDFADKNEDQSLAQRRNGYILPSANAAQDILEALNRAKVALKFNTDTNVSLSSAMDYATKTGLDPLEYWRFPMEENGAIDACHCAFD